MPDAPRFTIVIPSFNQGQYIEETIRSILLQNYPNLELFVMDGGSKDDTCNVLRKYDRWITGWVSEKDRGQTHAINKGFLRSTGDIHAYINSDDFYLPGALAKVAKAFADHPSADIIHGVCRKINEQGVEIGTHQGKLRNFAEALNVWEHWWKNDQFIQPEVFWKADRHRAVGPFREELYFVMDYDFWLRLFREGATAQAIDEDICCFRVLPEQKSARKDELSEEMLTKVVGPMLADKSVKLSPEARRRMQDRWDYQCRFLYAVRDSIAAGESRTSRYRKLLSVLMNHPGMLRLANCRQHIRQAVLGSGSPQK
jgi:glycosyltransferase involved in cell wall biosynthesis